MVGCLMRSARWRFNSSDSLWTVWLRSMWRANLSPEIKRQPVFVLIDQSKSASDFPLLKKEFSVSSLVCIKICKVTKFSVSHLQICIYTIDMYPNRTKLTYQLWLGSARWNPLVEWTWLVVEIPLDVKLRFLRLVVIKVTVQNNVFWTQLHQLGDFKLLDFDRLD